MLAISKAGLAAQLPTKLITEDLSDFSPVKKEADLDPLVRLVGINRPSRNERSGDPVDVTSQHTVSTHRCEFLCVDREGTTATAAARPTLTRSCVRERSNCANAPPLGRSLD